ncbi:MAG: TetR/AcrR family transcriptional regulator [Solirubrobacteraceae bacterium]|nr:TetR/AcrR family transcriptional regulator [Solirubrobacteraceae bacterium]
MPTQVQRTASARRRLISAATALVAEQGVGNTSVAAIGERAGMSRGAVNFHFGSKDDLLTAVAEEVTADWEARAFKHEIPDGVPFQEGLSAMLRAHREDMGGDEDRFRIFAMLFFEAMGPSPHLHEHFARLHRRVRARMVEMLEGLQSSGQISTDVDNEAFVAFVVGAFRGLTFQKLLDPAAVDLDRAYAELGRTIIARLSA